VAPAGGCAQSTTAQKTLKRVHNRHKRKHKVIALNTSSDRFVLLVFFFAIFVIAF
jgi:hypothetical protein